MSLRSQLPVVASSSSLCGCMYQIRGIRQEKQHCGGQCISHWLITSSPFFSWTPDLWTNFTEVLFTPDANKRSDWYDYMRTAPKKHIETHSVQIWSFSPHSSCGHIHTAAWTQMCLAGNILVLFSISAYTASGENNNVLWTLQMKNCICASDWGGLATHYMIFSQTLGRICLPPTITGELIYDF